MGKSATPSTPGLRGQLAQAVAWNTLFTPIKFFIDLIANLIKINLLSKAEVGTLSLFSSATSLVGIWIDFGIDQALPKSIPEIERTGGQGAVRRFLNQIIKLKMVILAIALLAIPWWGGLVISHMRDEVAKLVTRYGSEVALLQHQLLDYGWLFLGAVALLLLLGSLDDTLKTYLISFFRQKAWNVIVAIAALLLPVLSAAAVLMGLGVLGVIAAIIITTLVSVLITWGSVRRAMRSLHGRLPDAPIPAGTWQRFAPYAGISFLLSVTDLLTSQYFAIYWLQGGLQEIAVYWIAYSVIKQVQGFVYAPMGGLQVPLFTQVRAEGDLRLGRVFNTVARLFLVLFVPAGILLSVFLHNLILIQFPDYAAAVPAALVLIPFIFFEPFGGLGQNVLMVHEQYRSVVISRLATFVSIPLLIVLGGLGAPGIAAAMGTGRMLAGLIVLVQAIRLYRLHFPWGFAAKLALASTIAATAAFGLLAWVQIPFGTTSIPTRLLYLAISAIVGLAALGLLLVSARRLRLLQDDDRALLAEIRNPLARRLGKLL